MYAKRNGIGAENPANKANLSNWSSGVQILCDICTRVGHYLYSTKCSWVISAFTVKSNKNSTNSQFSIYCFFFCIVRESFFTCVLKVVTKLTGRTTNS